MMEEIAAETKKSRFDSLLRKIPFLLILLTATTVLLLLFSSKQSGAVDHDATGFLASSNIRNKDGSFAKKHQSPTRNHDEYVRQKMRHVQSWDVPESNLFVHKASIPLQSSSSFSSEEQEQQEQQQDQEQQQEHDQYQYQEQDFATQTHSFVLPEVSKACPIYPDPPPLKGKKGIGFTLRPEVKPGSWVENVPRVKALKVYWNYDWGIEHIAQQPENVEFVPMLWGGPRNLSTVQEMFNNFTLPEIEKGNIHRLLAFNEPDKPEQSNVAVARALEIWPTLEATGLPLVSPSCANPLGDWMLQFMGNITVNCGRVDWIGVHMYPGPDVISFQDRLKLIHATYNRPLLLTEFAVADWSATTVEDNKYSPAQVLAFVKLALPWLEQQDWIAGYAWFPSNVTSAVLTSSALFDNAGKLTRLGKYYATRVKKCKFPFKHVCNILRQYLPL